MQVCTSLQTDNHASTPPLTFFYRPDALPAAQPTASKHLRHFNENMPHKTDTPQYAVAALTLRHGTQRSSPGQIKGWAGNITRWAPLSSWTARRAGFT